MQLSFLVWESNYLFSSGSLEIADLSVVILRGIGQYSNTWAKSTRDAYAPYCLELVASDRYVAACILRETKCLLGLKSTTEKEHTASSDSVWLQICSLQLFQCAHPACTHHTRRLYSFHKQADDFHVRISFYVSSTACIWRRRIFSSHRLISSSTLSSKYQSTFSRGSPVAWCSGVLWQKSLVLSSALWLRATICRLLHRFRSGSLYVRGY